MRTDIGRHGTAWAADWIDAGVLQGLGIIAPGSGARIAQAALEGGGADVCRVLAAMWLELFARVRLGLRP